MGQEWSKKVIGDCPERNYTVEETADYIRMLLEMDNKYIKCIEKCVYGFLDYRMADTEQPDDVREAVSNPEYVRLSGSCADGGAICRWFRHGIPDVELDITFQIGSIAPDKEGFILAPIPEKPGFLKVYNSWETYKCLIPILCKNHPETINQFANHTPKQQFINTMDMKGDIYDSMSLRDNTRTTEKLSALLMGVDESTLRLLLTEKVVGPSNMLELIICLRDEKAIAYSSDTVVTLKVEKFPGEMEPCLERFNKFLPSDVVEKLKRACTHIVAKKSPGTESEEEWRRSTAEFEHILMKTWCEPGNDQKMVCYFTLKCLFYRHIRGIEVGNKYFTSYTLKTVMFWMVEEMDAAEWTDSNFMKNMKMALNHLMEYVKCKKLPNYFIPEMNVIDPSEYPSDLTDVVVEKLAEMIQNLETFMPRDLEKMVKQGQAMLEGINAILLYINYMTMKADQESRRHAGAECMSGVEEVLHVLNSTGFDVNNFLKVMFDGNPGK